MELSLLMIIKIEILRAKHVLKIEVQLEILIPSRPAIIRLSPFRYFIIYTLLYTRKKSAICLNKLHLITLLLLYCRLNFIHKTPFSVPVRFYSLPLFDFVRLQWRITKNK